MNLAKFQFRGFAKGVLDFRGILRLDSRHLHHEAVNALTENHRFGNARCVETFFNDRDRVVCVLNGHRDFFPFLVLSWLYAHRERGAAHDVNRTLEFFIERREGHRAEHADRYQQHRAHIAFAFLALGGEIPAEQHQQDHAVAEQQQRVGGEILEP